MNVEVPVPQVHDQMACSFKLLTNFFAVVSGFSRDDATVNIADLTPKRDGSSAG